MGGDTDGRPARNRPHRSPISALPQVEQGLVYFQIPGSGRVGGGFTEEMPEGTVFGHAASLISANAGRPSVKMRRLEEAGAIMAVTLDDVVSYVQKAVAEPLYLEKLIHVEVTVETKPKVFVTRKLPQEVWEELRQHVDAELWDYETPPAYDVLLEKVRGKNGLLCLLTDRIDAKLMDAGPELKVISQIAVGFDNIDVTEATARGIRVGNTPGVLTNATADFAFSLLMSAARRIGEGIDYVRQGKWKTWGLTLLLGQEIYGRTLGLIGMGRIGQAVAKRARGFDMKILYTDQMRIKEAEEESGAEYRSLEELLRESDFVSLHVNLNDQTRGLIGPHEFDIMKPSAVLINTARGPIVDHEALYEALKGGKIGYAALDVTDPEPLPDDDKLLSLPNIIIVPHIASATVTARTQMCMMAVHNLVAGLKGEELPFPVN